MSKYRFKTKEEFIRDELWDEENNCPYNWASTGEMNKYLGIDVPDEFNVYCDENESFHHDDWFFRNTDYVLITSDVFKKGEYIVLISDGQSTGGTTLVQSNQFIKNHCYKVRENNKFLRPELDSCGGTTNGWECILYNPNKFHKTRNWRYATQEEIDEYERRGKPYDVVELNKQSFPNEGSIEIEYIPKNLISYLENNNRKSVSSDSSYNKEKVVIAWNKSYYWFCSVESFRPKYSKDFIETIIGQSIYTDKSKELHSTYGNTSLSVKLLSNKTTHLINNVREISSVNLKIK